MKRYGRILAIALAIVVVLGAGGLLWARYRRRAAATVGTDASNSATIQVERGDIRVLVSGNGKVEPYQREDIKADIEGNIVKVNVEEGSQVKKGDIIAEIDPGTSLASAENEIRLIENKIKLQEVSIKELEKDLADLISIKNNLKISVPHSGVLSMLSVEVGDKINRDQKIGIVDDTSQLRIALPFEKEKVASVKPGQKVDVYLTDYIENGIKTQGEVSLVTVSQPEEGKEIIEVEVVLEGKPGYEPGANASFALNIDGEMVAPLATGKLEVINSYPLISPGSGQIVKMLKKEKDWVAKGDIIIELENENIGLDIQKARYNLDNARIELENLKNQLAQAQEGLEDLKADCILSSPVDGVVSVLNVEPGDQAAKGGVIASITGTSKLVVPVKIDELDIGKVKSGQTVNITLDAMEGKAFQGTVEKVAVEGTNENGVGVFEVLIGITNPGGIKPGMSANVEILVAEKKDTLILPIEAVQKVGDRYMVMVKPKGGQNGESGKSPEEGSDGDSARPLGGLPAQSGNMSGAGSGQQGRARMFQNMKPIQVGLVNETYVEVLEGLNEGDQVIVIRQNGASSMNQMRMPGMPGGNTVRRFTMPRAR